MIKQTSHYIMNWTDEEKEENTKLLKQELKTVNYSKEFEALGVDIEIKNGRDFSLVCNLIKDDRLIASINLGKPSYPVKHKNGNTIDINYKKENIEEQLRSNLPFLPYEMRKELDLFLYRCKYEQKDSTNPLYSSQEKLMMRMNKLNDVNNEVMAQLKIMEPEQLISYLGNMSLIREDVNGADLRKDFKCDKFTADQDYSKFIVGVKDAGDIPRIDSYLVIREHEQNGVKGFVGGVITHQDGLYNLQTLTPIQKLDRELLREALSRPNQLPEVAKEIEPEPVKSNVVPFEKPQEEVLSVDDNETEYEEEPDEPEQKQARKSRFKP